MKYVKMNRLQKKANRQLKLKETLQGEGLYVYENNTKGDLNLPKPTASGKKNLRVGEQFQGDNYFMRYVPTMLRYIRCIVPAEQSAILEENTVSEEKLILDQPERITSEGQVEHVIKQPQTQINENQPAKKPEVLINEDPMEGVEIILG